MSNIGITVYKYNNVIVSGRQYYIQTAEMKIRQKLWLVFSLTRDTSIAIRWFSVGEND